MVALLNNRQYPEWISILADGWTATGGLVSREYFERLHPQLFPIGQRVYLTVDGNSRTTMPDTDDFVDEFEVIQSGIFDGARYYEIVSIFIRRVHLEVSQRARFPGDRLVAVKRSRGREIRLVKLGEPRAVIIFGRLEGGEHKYTVDVYEKNGSKVILTNQEVLEVDIL